MRVLVIGGTGFNGRPIVARLLDQGHAVTVVSRGDLPAAQVGKVTQVRVNRSDRAAFTSAFGETSFDAVIDNIGYEPSDVQISIDTFGSRIGQYLFTSTLAVHHDLLRRLIPAREDSVDLTYRPAPDEGLETALHHARGHAYAVSKRQVEQVVASGPAPWTALRASMIVGPYDWVGGIWWWIQRLLDGGPILVPEIGSGHVFNVTYVEDLANAFIGALGNPVAQRRAYNVVAPDLLSTDTWAAALAEPIGRTVNLVYAPRVVIDAAGLSGYNVPIAGLPFGHAMLDVHRAEQELGFVASPLSAWASDTAHGFTAHPPEKPSRNYDRRDLETTIATAYRHARAAAEAACIRSLAGVL